MKSFYTNVQVYGSRILYRGVEDGRKVKRKIDYFPTLYVPAKEHTGFTSVSGDAMAEMKPGNIRETRDFVETYKDVQNFKIYGNQKYEYAFIADHFSDDVDWDLSHINVTNIDIDHLDHFSTFDNMVESFERFINAVAGPRVVCADDASLSAIALKHNVTTYAIHSPAQFTARNVQFHDGGSTFDVLHHEVSGDNGLLLGRVALQLRGEHNVANALGVIAMSKLLGVEFGVISSALVAFSGVSRRFDQRGNDNGVSFVDDYAHLPTEISAVLSSCRDETDSWKRVIAVFQPNRFNRMQHMSDTYADCFAAADHVVITDIYSSGTTPIAGVTGKLVVDAIARAHPNTSLAWKPTRAELIQHLATELRSGDLCISMGCGDIETLPDEVITARRALRGGS